MYFYGLFGANESFYFKKQCHYMCKYKASMFPEANNELRTEAASPSFSVQNEIVETIKCVAPLVRV